MSKIIKINPLQFIDDSIKSKNKEYFKKRYEEKKDIKITCPWCDSITNIPSIDRHLKSKKCSILKNEFLENNKDGISVLYKFQQFVRKVKKGIITE